MGCEALPVILDYFHDADNTNLQDHRMNLGTGWVKKLDDAPIVGNKLVGAVQSASGDTWYLADGGVNKGTIEFEIDYDPNDGQVNLYCGVELDTNRGWMAMLGDTTSLYERGDNGNGVVKAVTGIGVLSGPQTWKMVLSEKNVIIYRNDIVVLHYHGEVRYGNYWGFELYNRFGAGQQPGTKVLSVRVDA